MPAKNGQTLLPGFDGGFVDAVKLQELAVTRADFLFNMTLPQVSRETELAVWLLVYGDVIGAFQLEDVIAFGFVFVIAPGFGVLEQGQAHFLACRAQGFDVFNLCCDGSEVTHGFLMFLR